MVYSWLYCIKNQIFGMKIIAHPFAHPFASYWMIWMFWAFLSTRKGFHRFDPDEFAKKKTKKKDGPKISWLRKSCCPCSAVYRLVSFLHLPILPSRTYFHIFHIHVQCISWPGYQALHVVPGFPSACLTTRSLPRKKALNHRSAWVLLQSHEHHMIFMIVG